MTTREELVEKLGSAFAGHNCDDVADASAELARYELQAQINELKRVLTSVADTLPHIGGNDRSVDAMMKDIWKALSK